MLNPFFKVIYLWLDDSRVTDKVNGYLLLCAQTYRKKDYASIIFLAV